MPYTSKSEIEQVLSALTTQWNAAIPDGEPAINAAKLIMQGLLTQQEGEPANNALLTTPELAALTRFCETCEDGEGYDVPKTMMQRLAQIGVVRHLSRGIYNITEFGETVVDTHPAPFTPITAVLLSDDEAFDCECNNYANTAKAIQQAFCAKNNLTLGAKK